MDENSWKGRLAAALDILDDLEARGGGGTVLMMRYRRRLSKVIDLFLHDARWLAYRTPRLNEHAAAKAHDYSEPANSMKLVLDDGDMDFIVSGSVTGEMLDFRGRAAPLGGSAESLAKKRYFRAGLLKPRDILDLVTVHLADALAATRAIAASAPRRPEQLKRLKTLESLSLAALEQDIHCLGDFGAVLPSLISSATTLLGAAR